MPTDNIEAEGSVKIYGMVELIFSNRPSCRTYAAGRFRLFQEDSLLVARAAHRAVQVYGEIVIAYGWGSIAGLVEYDGASFLVNWDIEIPADPLALLIIANGTVKG